MAARGQQTERNAANRKDRVFVWSPPFGAGDAKQIFEANSRMTSAEFSADGKTLFVNEGNDLYAVRLADPAKHYEIAKGATIAAGGRGGRGGAGGGAGGRGGAGSDSAFYANPGALQTKRGPNGAPGFWMTKKSNSVLGGSPSTWTSMTSTVPPGLMLTVAAAFGRQPDATSLAPRCIGNSNFFSRAAALTPARPVRTVAATMLAPIEPGIFICVLSNRRAQDVMSIGSL